MEDKMREIQIKVKDDDLKGGYSNVMNVSHNKEEFFIDFLNILPPTGVLTARIIVSPGHLKRITKVLQRQLEIYEARFGEVKEAQEPPKTEIRSN